MGFQKRSPQRASGFRCRLVFNARLMLLDSRLTGKDLCSYETCIQAFLLPSDLDIFAALPASAQKATTPFDHNYVFSQFKRYQWRENRLLTRQSPDTTELMDLKIGQGRQPATKARKDLLRLRTSPISTSTTMAVRTQTCVPAVPPKQAPVPRHPLSAASASKKPVWETTYSKTIRDPHKALRDMDKEVNELVAKSFKDFPPKSKK